MGGNPTQSETLLPCPFCGHEAVVVSDNGRGLMFNVHCGKCRASGPWELCASDAKHEWNTRLQSIPEPLLDEGLVETVKRSIADIQLTLEAVGHRMPPEAAEIFERIIRDTAAALSIPRLEAGRVTGSLTLDNASVQRLMDYGLLHYTDEGWVVSKDIWNASAPDGPALTELEEKSK